ncbi:unnamed protein product [Cunninghamella blakesleeana]
MTIYSVPKACEQLFQSAILNNEKIKLSEEFKKLANKVKFEGTEEPSLPINWRYGEVASVLKAFEGLSMLYLIQNKYNTLKNENNVASEEDGEKEVIINTDHAQGFLFSAMTIQIKDKKTNQFYTIEKPEFQAFMKKYIKNMDFNNNQKSIYNSACTGIYKTKDNRYYQLHGSLDHRQTQRALGIPTDDKALFNKEEPYTFQEARAIYENSTLKYTADELDDLIHDQYGQAGSICYSVDEYRKTEQYKSNEHVGLYETEFYDDHTPPHWWTLENLGSAERPLAGLKVLDITRVLAAPVITRSLAEYGASVIRVTSPDLPDLSLVHLDTNTGKWTCELDFKKESHLDRLHELIREADVVVTGYRPYRLDKYGLGVESLLKMAQERGRGIIYCRENCYGWHGPWKKRIGWQQVSDACCGSSKGYAESMGMTDGSSVTPVLPITDYATGIVGATAIIQALVDRSKKGGSYVIGTALNYTSNWMINEIGNYNDDDPQFWEYVWKKKGQPQIKYTEPLALALPRYIQLLKQYSPHLFHPDFFERRELLEPFSDTFELYALKPVVKIIHQQLQLQLGFSIPTRGNGVDAPFWPNDLLVKQII